MTNKIKSTFVHVDPTEILRALVGLKDVRVLALARFGPEVELWIEQLVEYPSCPDCGTRARVKERPVVRYTDLPVFGTPMRLAWRKHRLQCSNGQCSRNTWVLDDHRIAAKNCLLTTRCAKWATKQVGNGRTVLEVAVELECDWHTINDAVVVYGTELLKADRKRLKDTEALGLDETAFVRTGPYKRKQFCTTVADVGNAQLIDILPTRDYVEVAQWIGAKPRAWKDRIHFGALDMSNVFAAVYSVTLPKATQIVDRFHVIQLANRYLDAVRRRVQNEQLGHRGRKDDPLYKIRKLLLMGKEKLSEQAVQRLEALVALGDPGAEVSLAYNAKEAIRDFYATPDPEKARELLTTLQEHCAKKSMPPELQQFARTLRKWFNKILAWHEAHYSNGPAEGLNNLIKRIKRIGFGFRNFENYRIRALLYAGKPNWRVLDSIVVQ